MTGVLFGVVVVGAAVAPWQAFGLLLVVAGAIGAWELIGLRRAGPPVLIQAVALAAGLAAVFWLKVLSDALAHQWVGPPLIFLAILPTWAADVAAYLVGSAIGSHKLAPRLSPGKSWEGTIAGFVAAGIVAGALATASHLPSLVTLVLLIGPVGLAGDLLESWIKRRADVKDSGALFPGHGGLLDRIDSLLAASMLVFALYAPGCCMSPSGMMDR